MGGFLPLSVHNAGRQNGSLEKEVMGIGVWQIVLILAIVLIIFGAGKLPKVMGDMGKGIKSFKAGINEKEQDDDAGASAKTIENTTSASVSTESKDKDSVKS
ncbi:twin-arginine translocase TatA/TatE family subunit [Thalassospira lucentensis]